MYGKCGIHGTLSDAFAEPKTPTRLRSATAIPGECDTAPASTRKLQKNHARYPQKPRKPMFRTNRAPNVE